VKQKLELESVILVVKSKAFNLNHSKCQNQVLGTKEVKCAKIHNNGIINCNLKQNPI